MGSELILHPHLLNTNGTFISEIFSLCHLIKIQLVVEAANSCQLLAPSDHLYAGHVLLCNVWKSSHYVPNGFTRYAQNVPGHCFSHCQHRNVDDNWTPASLLHASETPPHRGWFTYAANKLKYSVSELQEKISSFFLISPVQENTVYDLMDLWFSWSAEDSDNSRKEENRREPLFNSRQNRFRCLSRLTLSSSMLNWRIISTSLNVFEEDSNFIYYKHVYYGVIKTKKHYKEKNATGHIDTVD